MVRAGLCNFVERIENKHPLRREVGTCPEVVHGETFDLDEWQEIGTVSSEFTRCKT